MKHMIDAAHLEPAMQDEESIISELRLQILLTRLFVDRKVEFFDAEPDEEFIEVFNRVDKCTIEERRKALLDFECELKLHQNFVGEYGRMSEVLIQSEDFARNIGVPFLMYNLSDDEDKNDPTYSFRLDFMEVYYAGDDRFLLALHVRNVRHSHMEMYMRFTREEASRVVRAILRIYEDYMGYSSEPPVHACRAGNELEEIFASEVGRLGVRQLAQAEGAADARFRGISLTN